ncbi:unnamed protein product [Alopecurus aequalis]
MKSLATESWKESKLLWRVAFPAVLTEVFQFSIGFVTASFVGHIGVVELAAVTVVESILEGFAYGVLRSSAWAAPWTRCAARLWAPGSWTRWASTSSSRGSSAAPPRWCSRRRTYSPRRFSGLSSGSPPPSRSPPGRTRDGRSRGCWPMPPTSRSRSSSRHRARLGYGLRGAAVVGNISYWLIDAAQFVYLVSGRFPDAWKGFSILAFSNLAAFVKLSLVSAVMICLEFWYYAALLILVGILKNGQLQLDIMSVCINYEFWTMMVALGFSEAVSVRVSNELGASRPQKAKFSVAVAATTSAFIGAIFMAVFFIWRRSLPRLFSDDEEVVQGASRLGYLLAVTVFFGSIGPVLSGVAVGAGWQLLVAFANIGCYYLVGIPFGVLFGFKFKLGALGIWMGMLTGTLLQMAILFFIIMRTDWEKQALLAAARIKVVGGKNEDQPLMPATGTEDDQIDTTSTVELNMQTCGKNIELVYNEEE